MTDFNFSVTVEQLLSCHKLLKESKIGQKNLDYLIKKKIGKQLTKMGTQPNLDAAQLSKALVFNNCQQHLDCKQSKI